MITLWFVFCFFVLIAIVFVSILVLKNDHKKKLALHEFKKQAAASKISEEAHL